MPPNFAREALDSAGTRSGTFCESCGSLRIGSSGRVKSLSCFGMMMLALGTAQVWRNGDLYHDFAGMKQAENMDVRIATVCLRRARPCFSVVAGTKGEV